MKVLIIQNKRIGDVLISSVIANNYKAKHPDATIHFMAYDFTHGVLLNNPNIDKIISINDKELKRLPVLLKLIRKIKKEHYDIIIDPYSKTQSRLICKFSGAKQTIGHKSRKKIGQLGFYTHPVAISKEKTKICGKAIEDRIHLLQQADTFSKIDYEPKLFLSEAEKNENLLGHYANKKVIVFGILGSTPQKSMPYEYVAEIVDFISNQYDVYIMFNYAPNQKAEAQKIYNLCQKKENIILDIYAPTIRDFIKLMYQSALLVSNEGGTVHIAKALNKPTFTIFSPYVNKDHWASFEDGKFHTSVHLLEMKPDLFDSFTFEERKKIEANPEELYLQLTPELILPQLDQFLKNNL
ncbi:glycosyltransferase family 9 protein [Flavobacterium faecale]|uniref:glycosyltransferase family 9 protein n=1 Tax=Flavobacterium faecale TaxID=1355330 RepID=UPI003AB0DABE